MDRPSAAILTVGTELTSGLRADTNGGEIARALLASGYLVDRLTSVPDDEARIAAAIADAVATHDLVVVTGGLGPTHDDLTREATARALGVGLTADPDLLERMREVGRRHASPSAAAAALKQADVLEGARVLAAQTGTAPGQVVAAGRATLVLLPGPPREMRPLLHDFLSSAVRATPPNILRCVGITESDAGAVVSEVLASREGIGFTLLAAPSLVDVVLFDNGAGAAVLDSLARAAATALGSACYSTDGRSLAEVVIADAAARGTSIACAESCTGGGVAVSLTDVPGASAVFLGSVVSYADTAKTDLLGVSAGIISEHGAVSAEAATAMADGARDRFGADIAVSVTGIAGPEGGTPAKPVGLVWFAVASDDRPTTAVERRFAGDRGVVRSRAAVHALDLLRHALAGE